MKKVLFILVALAVAMSFGAPAMAKQGLSAGLGIGFLPNAGQLGSTIVDDGLTKDLDLAALGAPDVYDTLTIVEAEDTLLDDQRTSQMAGSTAVTGVTVNGPMNALDIQLQVRYDFLGYLFARTGINWAMKWSGGETSWKINGVKQSQTWDYEHLIIPFTVGLNLPIGGTFNVYAGLTAAYVQGGWEVALSRTSLSDTLNHAALQGALNGLVFPGGARVKETAKFEVAGMGMGYVLGFTAEVYSNVNAFIEFESLAYGEMSRYDIKNAGMRAISLNHFNKYVVVGGQFFRIGATYNFGFATI